MTARILVADGVATNRITLKVRLVASCYEVVTAASPAQLVAQSERKRPDLIVLGGGFADIKPVDLCQRLTSGSANAPAPILMLAPQSERLAALRAGAAAVLDPAVDEQMLLARIRGLLRDVDGLEERQVGLAIGFAEAPVAFDPARPCVTLVADTAGRGLCWKHLLAQRLDYRFVINDPEEALGAAAAGRASDLYLIAADVGARGDGLRLLSELRSRSASRDAAYIIATAPDRAELAPIALDLGASDVLPLELGGQAGAEMSALALEAQLQRKRRGDQRRAEAQRHMLWAMTDPLTGLYNRRYALPRLTEIAREADQTGGSFAVLAMDLDRFKRINDRHGHPAGDAVLCNVAALLSERIGQTGVVARLGGEEFLAVLPHRDDTEAFHSAEDIRKTIEAHPTQLPRRLGHAVIHATLSIGVATGPDPSARMSADSLAERALERADQALLTAKSLGRNRVMLAQAERAA